MYKLFKSFLIIFSILCLSLSAIAVEKKPTTSISIKKAPPTIQQKKAINPVRKIPLTVRNITLKNNTIHVTVATTKTLLPVDYTGMILHVTAPKQKAGKKWTLQKVDPKRSLLRSKKSIFFNTKISISTPGIVKATISKGTWKSSKTKSLIPTKTMVAKQKAKKKIKKKPGMKTLGKAPQVKPGTDKPVVPMISKGTTRAPSSRVNSAVSERAEASAAAGDDIYRDMGINIFLPIKDKDVDQRDTIHVSYKVTGDQAPGDITFRLMRGGLIVDTKTRAYSVPEYPDNAIETFQWRIPATAPLTKYYYIHAIQPSTGAVGFGHYFEVTSKFSVTDTSRSEMYFPIDILEPVANDEVVWGETRQIAWTMPQEDEPGNCGNRVTIYTIKEGTDTRVEVRQGNTSPGGNAVDWFVNPVNIEIGRYHIEIESSEGCKIRGAAFEIKTCDFAVDSAAFDGPFDGRPLSTGIDASDGSSISGTFKVKLRWNRVEYPSTFTLGTDWNRIVRVQSRLTGNNIGSSASIDYSTAFGFGAGPDGDSRVSYIYVEIPFEIDRDDIAHMMNDSHNIPLEFYIDGWGLSDMDDSNNRLEADMKVSFANIVDLQMMFYIDEFSAPRDAHTPSSATTYQYHFNQVIRATNAASDETGGDPSDLLSVPVAWFIEYSNRGESGWHISSSGRSVYPIVGPDWPPVGPGSSDSLAVVEGSFTTPIGTDRTYRLRMVIDPDRSYIDTDRSNNEFKNTLNLPD